jgi:hypothetical protein
VREFIAPIQQGGKHMSTILLTDEEYTHIQGLMTDLTTRIKTASPRAATHYANVSKLCAKFLAREDGKRAERKTSISNRDSILDAKEARRTGSGTQARSAQNTPRPGNAPTSKSA